MAKEKSSFVIYYDLEEQTEDFSDEQLGKLLRAVFAYEKRGEVIEISDAVVKAAFGFMLVQLREGKRKYTERCEKNKAAADKRWEGNTGDTLVCEWMQTHTSVCKTCRYRCRKRYGQRYRDRERNRPRPRKGV